MNQDNARQGNSAPAAEKDGNEPDHSDGSSYDEWLPGVENFSSQIRLLRPLQGQSAFAGLSVQP